MHNRQGIIHQQQTKRELSRPPNCVHCNLAFGLSWLLVASMHHLSTVQLLLSYCNDYLVLWQGQQARYTTIVAFHDGSHSKTNYQNNGGICLRPSNTIHLQQPRSLNQPRATNAITYSWASGVRQVGHPQVGRVTAPLQSCPRRAP